MTQASMDILEQFPVRKSKAQKRAFRDGVADNARSMGYSVNMEPGGFGCQNIIIGDPETARCLLTAHYDTPVWRWFPQLRMTRNLPLFLLSQLLQLLGIFTPAVLAAVVAAVLMPGTMRWYPVAVGVLWMSLLVLTLGPANAYNANNNTAGVAAVLEIAATLPENLRHRVCFVLFDGTEPGMLGSRAYRKAHREASQGQIVFNLDRVGSGDEILLMPSASMARDPWLKSLERNCGPKSIRVCPKGFSRFPSDHRRFPKGIGICAQGKPSVKRRDIDHTNINILRACLITYISGGAVE